MSDTSQRVRPGHSRADLADGRDTGGNGATKRVVEQSLLDLYRALRQNPVSTPSERSLEMTDTVKYVLDESRLRRPGTTSRPTFRHRRHPSSTRAPANRSGRTTWRRSSPCRSSCRRSRPTVWSPSRRRCARSIGQWRPTPLYRARRLEAALETPARIYYKYEGVSPTGLTSRTRRWHRRTTTRPRV